MLHAADRRPSPRLTAAAPASILESRVTVRTRSRRLASPTEAMSKARRFAAQRIGHVSVGISAGQRPTVSAGCETGCPGPAAPCVRCFEVAEERKTCGRPSSCNIAAARAAENLVAGVDGNIPAVQYDRLVPSPGRPRQRASCSRARLVVTTLKDMPAAAWAFVRATVSPTPSSCRSRAGEPDDGVP